MIEKIKTDTGIEVIFDKLESISTCSVGVFVKTGSRDESDTEEGISHVLEHMIFKGTPTRSYFEISEEIDYLGANVNAHTTKEETVFYINALTQFLGKSVDILFDIVTNSTIDEKELEKEKDVIVEEIKMYKDSPDDLVFETNYADCINGQYGKPIIGTEESVKGFTAEEIRKYYRERYTKDNILVVVSGNFDKDEIIQKINEYFGKLADTKVDRREKIDFSFNAGKRTVSKDINQVNICISHKSEDYNSEKKVYTDILSNIIGGSMSSRLFQEIREKNGLAYSVYTYNQYYLSGGLTSTYIGTNLESYEKAIEITLLEFKKLRENGVTEEELQKSKNKYISRISFAMENPRSRMGILGNYYIRKNEILDTEKLKNEVNTVRLEDVNNFARMKYLEENITVLGNINV
ncbi:M16 family metallopeptidase [Leptotrichia buccalis]|uniref:Peptidase M16 domain protein n=1 Tax=Leptotrichia buccalis (strain ATCC 14201 / DSM 1135 / JCM 12969 / NCTC 10249 / C-1013-b) TaxID=523794 RepID=C7NC31_LEPBD|nr:pitrilysin family protein [Leptotrichia buccalis]ACV39712.1 peptidase M16 domain protein [Leptotrichia buccalis C-1013-b]